MNLKTNWFSYLITTTLVALSALFQSSSFAYAAVLALVITLFRDIVEHKVFTMKDIKLTIPEDMTKKLADMNSRITAIEYERSQRGF